MGKKLTEKKSKEETARRERHGHEPSWPRAEGRVVPRRCQSHPAMRTRGVCVERGGGGGFRRTCNAAPHGIYATAHTPHHTADARGSRVRSRCLHIDQSPAWAAHSQVKCQPQDRCKSSISHSPLVRGWQRQGTQTASRRPCARLGSFQSAVPTNAVWNRS